MPPSHPWASSSSMLDLVLPDGRTDPIPAPPFHRCFFPLIPGMMAELGLWPTTLWLVLRSLGMIGLWSVFSHSPSLLLLVQDIITCLFPIYSPAIAVCHCTWWYSQGSSLSHVDPEPSKLWSKYFPCSRCQVLKHRNRLPANISRSNGTQKHSRLLQVDSRSFLSISGLFVL